MKYVATDAPSSLAARLFKEKCKNFEVLSLDPVHLAFVWEYATWRKRTAGSKALRALLQKLSQRQDPQAYNTWGPPYYGENPTPLSAQEEFYRDQIRSSSMSERSAKRVLSSFDYETPFRTRLEFVKGLAAISAIYSDEVARISPRPNRRVRELLWSAASPDRLEWYFNNLRARHLMKMSHHALLHVGTTSNESLHKEINAWFRQTQHLHQSTLDLKLQVLHLGKLLPHNAAMYHHTQAQASHDRVLGHISGVNPWSTSQWLAWCGEQVDGDKVLKADLPLQDQRSLQQAAVKAKVEARKRPAAASVGPHLRLKRKRTPFTLERQRVCKKPASNR